MNLKKWLCNWWKKEVAVFVAMGTRWGVIAACGIVPEGYGYLFLIITIILSIVISTIWTIINVYKLDGKSELKIDHREGVLSTLSALSARA